jgi:hypothetical protein
MSRHNKHKTPEGTPNAAEPLPPEPREQTNGFEFPVGVASGQATPVKFYCYAAQCPGYAYSASDQAHPVETCGTLMNSLDNPLHSKPEGKVSEIMKENAQVSAAIAATETTGFATDRLSGIFSDGSSDSKPEEEQSPEPHTDVEASEHPIVTQTAEQAEQERAAIAHASRVYDAIELRGSLGMFCEQPNDAGWIEVLAAESGGFIQLCEYHQANGVDSWTITRRDYDGWLQIIPFSGFLRIVKPKETPDWVQALYEHRNAAFAEGIIGTSSEEPEASTDMPQLEPAPVDPKDTQVLSIALHCVDIANELNVDVLQVMRLVDGLVQTFAQFVSFKELVASTPLVPALFDHFLSPDARAKLMTLVKGMADGPIRSTINGVAQAAVDDFETKLADIQSRLLKYTAEFEAGEEKAQNEDDSNEYRIATVKALSRIDTTLDAMKEDQARALGTMEHQIELLGEKVDTINNDLGLLEERMNQVQPDWQPPKGKKAPKSKPSPLPNGKKADFFQTSREELERLRREGKVPTVSEFDDDEDDDFELDDDDDEVIEAVAPPSRRPPPSKAAKKRAMRANAKARREAKAKVSSRPPPAKAPLKGPKRGGLFAQARRKPGRPPKKPPVQNRPMGDTPKSAKWGAIEKFMGKKHLPKVRTLLGRMETDKLAKFLAGAKKGFFHMDLTGWTVQEQGAFIKWFYAKH